ncbi:hypothetical protein H2509_09350 [Stappia sp. F7233]|uniref:PepSY domain-containing protein n=1 Tax=Stappia albiluteola TaxID=2758565 RepID=A0A839ACU4_9HYPH|nr:hypothetical protein [Stappia albiluteola]MBA5777331.1 hypothetical protein [Stappia albiluteola]
MFKSSVVAAALAIVMSVGAAEAASAHGVQKGIAIGNSTITIDWRGPGRHDHGRRWERLAPRQVARRLHRQGYRDIRDIRPRGNVYVVHASGRRDLPVRLVVDAFSGEVLGRTFLRYGRGHGHGWGRGW